MSEDGMTGLRCGICGRMIAKDEYWSYGNIRICWMGDERYDGEPFFRTDFGLSCKIHPTMDARGVCQDCFGHMVESIRGIWKSKEDSE